jgi:4'-phosphopantetheinyl transferase
VDSVVQTWHKPPANLELSADEVQVWRVSLNQPHHTLLNLRGSLTTEERERTARFHFRRDRVHFIAARGLLRHILGLYLKLPPRSLQFRYSSYGKPYLQALDLGPNYHVALVAEGHGWQLKSWRWDD